MEWDLKNVWCSEIFQEWNQPARFVPKSEWIVIKENIICLFLCCWHRNKLELNEQNHGIETVANLTEMLNGHLQRSEGKSHKSILACEMLSVYLWLLASVSLTRLSGIDWKSDKWKPSASTNNAVIFSSCQDSYYHHYCYYIYTASSGISNKNSNVSISCNWCYFVAVPYGPVHDE